VRRSFTPSPACAACPYSAESRPRFPRLVLARLRYETPGPLCTSWTSDRSELLAAAGLQVRSRFCGELVELARLGVALDRLVKQARVRLIEPLRRSACSRSSPRRWLRLGPRLSTPGTVLRREAAVCTMEGLESIVSAYSSK
jgi:hypothetical protein